MQTGGNARLIAEEQAALRRVALLVARGEPPEGVFTAVTEEAGRLLGLELAAMSRYGPDEGTARMVASWSEAGDAFPVLARVTLGGRNVHTLVLETGRPVRLDDRDDVSGPDAAVPGRFGIQASVGVPVIVEGRVWGVLIVSSTREPLPADTETRLADFTELAATAIANAQARAELRGFADEESALRRVAVLVARGAVPEEVFTAVAEEAGQLLGADHAAMSRISIDGARTVVAAWSRTGRLLRPGLQAPAHGENMHTLVFETGQAARIDDYLEISGQAAEHARNAGIRAAVGVPVSVEGQLWGVMSVGSASGPLPSGTEERLAAFTELAATAIANAEARAELAASRARIVTAADTARRRIERNLHDGAQQRLILLALRLRELRAVVPPGLDDLVARLDGAIDEALRAHEELRQIAQGLHPAILTEGGLPMALRALARRSAIPVSLEVEVDERVAEPTEIAAYYTVAEALANTARHARASAAEVRADLGDGLLRVHVHDDGRGGANFGPGTGLTGLKDRIEALGGQISLHSPQGAGTTLEITLPAEKPHDR